MSDPNVTTIDPETAHTFLAAMHAGAPGYTEFRLRPEQGGRLLDRRFLAHGALAAPLAYLLAQNAATPSALLFSVNPRSTMHGGDAAVPAVEAAVVDLDGKGLSLDEQLRRMGDLCGLAAPVAIVRSGSEGHRHVYWRLTPAADPEEARAVFKRLRLWLEADPTEPPSRCMRLPGSANWKTGEPRRIELPLVEPANRTTLEKLSVALDRLGAARLEELVEQREPARAAARGEHAAPRAATLPPRASPASQRTPRAPSLQHMLDFQALRAVLPAWCVSLIEHGYAEAGYPSRSEADLAAAQLLVDIGLTYSEIAAIFAANPIGGKYREAGDAYLGRTIDVARQAHQLSLVKIERVEQWSQPYTQLHLRVVEGPHFGASFKGGLASVSSVWPHAFAACGLPPATPGTRAVLGLEGRFAWVHLREVTFGGRLRLEVARWQLRLQRAAIDESPSSPEAAAATAAEGL
jgi:hypothetical protein